MKALVKAASIMGMVMVGYMVASTVAINVNLTIQAGMGSVVINDILNSIYPGFLSLVVVFLLVYLIRKKHMRPTQLVLIVLAIGIIGGLLGIF